MVFKWITFQMHFCGVVVWDSVTPVCWFSSHVTSLFCIVVREVSTRSQSARSRVLWVKVCVYSVKVLARDRTLCGWSWRGQACYLRHIKLFLVWLSPSLAFSSYPMHRFASWIWCQIGQGRLFASARRPLSVWFCYRLK